MIKPDEIMPEPNQISITNRLMANVNSRISLKKRSGMTLMSPDYSNMVGSTRSPGALPAPCSALSLPMFLGLSGGLLLEIG